MLEGYSVGREGNRKRGEVFHASSKDLIAVFPILCMVDRRGVHKS